MTACVRAGFLRARNAGKPVLDVGGVVAPGLGIVVLAVHAQVLERSHSQTFNLEEHKEATAARPFRKGKAAGSTLCEHGA